MIVRDAGALAPTTDDSVMDQSGARQKDSLSKMTKQIRRIMSFSKAAQQRKEWDGLSPSFLVILATLFLLQVASPVLANGLCDAVRAGDKAKVEGLLSKGANIDEKDAYHLTPLHWAIIESQTGIAKYLIEKGANVSLRDGKNMTPLHWAVIEDKKEFAKLLIGELGEINLKDNSGKTPPHSAVDESEIVKLLVAKGADTNAKANNDWTPLFRVTNMRMASLLVAAGADVNAKSRRGDTPLHSAVLHSAKEVVELLIEKGADVNAKNDDGEIPLYSAIDNKEIAELLIAKSTEVNSKDNAMPADTIPLGLYYNESGSATLAVARSDSAAALVFYIKSMSPNGHQCSVSGEIRNNQAISEEKCVIDFEKLSDRISVNAPDEFGEACRSHCGAGNTTFSDDFYLETPYCAKADSIRAEFSRHYKTAQYPKAEGLLVELLGRCGQFMDWRTEASIRNDLAITEFRLKNSESCLKALEPLKGDFIDDHDISEMSFRYPYMDEDLVAETMKTTRFNWKKCGGSLPDYAE